VLSTNAPNAVTHTSQQLNYEVDTALLFHLSKLCICT